MQGCLASKRCSVWGLNCRSLNNFIKLRLIELAKKLYIANEFGIKWIAEFFYESPFESYTWKFTEQSRNGIEKFWSDRRVKKNILKKKWQICNMVLPWWKNDSIDKEKTSAILSTVHNMYYFFLKHLSGPES